MKFCTWTNERHASYLTYPRHRFFCLIVSGLQHHSSLEIQTVHTVDDSHRQFGRLALPFTFLDRHHVFSRMGSRNGVRVISLMEPRIPSECRHRLTAHFFLNLRSIFYRQQASTLESRARSLETPTVLNRPVRKQLSRIWTDFFVDLERHDTLYSSGNDLNDGDIGQVDIIVLEEVESQAHQQLRWV